MTSVLSGLSQVFQMWSYLSRHKPCSSIGGPARKPDPGPLGTHAGPAGFHMVGRVIPGLSNGSGVHFSDVFLSLCSGFLQSLRNSKGRRDFHRERNGFFNQEKKNYKSHGLVSRAVL